MHIIIAKNSGFCPGVNLAIKKTLEISENSGKKVYTFGPLIHNNDVIKELEKKGIKTIESIDEIKDLENSILVIRAHGIPPKLEEEIKKRGISYVDATCPLVKKVHNLIVDYKNKGYTTVIFGDEKHAEVFGLKGYAGENCIVIQSISDAEKLPHLGRVNLVSQTTQEEDIFLKIAEILKTKTDELIISNTICQPTRQRQLEVKNNAKIADLVVVVGARHSANTRRLFDICKKLNERTILIENEMDINEDILKGVSTIFITAGASTPTWILERVAERIREISKKYKFLRNIVNLFVSTGLLGFFSFSVLLFLAAKIQGINIKFYEYVPYIAALIFAYLVNRYSMINEENLRKIVFLRFSKTVKILIYLLAISSILSAFFIELSLGFFISLFILMSWLYRVYHLKYRKGRILNKTFVSVLGWLYILVIVPFLVYKRSLDLSFFLSLAYISSIAFVRNRLADMLYIQGDMVLSRGIGENLRISNLIYISVVVMVISSLLILEKLIMFLTLIISLYYIFLTISFSKQKRIDILKTEVLIDIPFVIIFFVFLKNFV